MSDYREELAWAAGFFDGEGYTGCLSTSKAKYQHLRMTIGQTSRTPLVRFHRAIGNLGRLTGPTICPGRKPIWTLNINGYEYVQAVVARLWPWLCRPKRLQATTALGAYLAYSKTVRNHVRRNR